MSPLQNTKYHPFVWVKLSIAYLGIAMRSSMKKQGEMEKITTLKSGKEILHHL
jgi:hypothetical protein